MQIMQPTSDALNQSLHFNKALQVIHMRRAEWATLTGPEMRGGASVIPRVVNCRSETFYLLCG